MTLLTLILALILAAIHLFVDRLRFLGGMPRSRWLSIAGGISVAYVFVHVLAELPEHQAALGNTAGLEGFAESHVYLIALLGLIVFYSLERLAKTNRRAQAENHEGTATEPGVFWLHILSFGVYNALIGYLLVHREEESNASLLLYAGALGLHFIVNDYSLRDHHKQRYQAIGRWLLAGAVLLGYGIGVLTEVSEAMLGAMFAFLAGGVILNVLKEELPEDRESNIGAFIVGAAFYTALILAAF